MNKPFHLLTPAERTALRIAQNRAIAEKIAQNPPSKVKAKTPKKPPAASTGEYIRATPDERAQIAGSLIRKVNS